MREAWLPHVARRLAACALFAFSVVLYQGCGDSPEDPYAALDAKFPAGRPPLADAQTRAQDADYLKKIQEGGRRYLTLNAAAEKAEHEADRFRTLYREALAKRMKQEPPEAILEDELAKHAHYQGLLKAAEEARAAAEAQRQANMKAIRDRTYADARAYDALRAEADEAARKAGLPVRQNAPAATPARQAAAAAPSTPKAPAAEPTVQMLSEATGKPVAPAKGGDAQD